MSESLNYDGVRRKSLATQGLLNMELRMNTKFVLGLFRAKQIVVEH